MDLGGPVPLFLRSGVLCLRLQSPFPLSSLSPSLPLINSGMPTVDQTDAGLGAGGPCLPLLPIAAPGLLWCDTTPPPPAVSQ